jgi:hypothetical protein
LKPSAADEQGRLIRADYRRRPSPPVPHLDADGLPPFPDGVFLDKLVPRGISLIDRASLTHIMRTFAYIALV